VLTLSNFGRRGVDDLRDDVTQQRETFDIVMASDCLYQAEAVEPFLSATMALCHATTRVLVFNQGFQEEATDAFWAEARRLFDVREILPAEVHPSDRRDFEEGAKWAAILQKKKKKNGEGREDEG
jgi:Lysine methyltransferase